MEIKIEKFEPKAYALCSSVCIISVDEETFPIKLISGGSVSWYLNDEIINGPGTVSRIPSKFKHLEKELLFLLKVVLLLLINYVGFWIV